METPGRAGDPAEWQAIAAAIKDKKIVVVGDVMLDRFVYGAVNRLSPESDAPVLDVRRTDTMPGGAANVAANVRALGATVMLAGVIGDDDAGRLLARLAAQDCGDAAGLVVDPGRPTTCKTRFVSAGGQLIRADEESRLPVAGSVAAALVAAVADALPGAAALVLSDYDKGVVTPGTAQRIIDLARGAGVPVLVDPKKADYRIYTGAALITPNRKELGEASGMPVDGDDAVAAAAASVMARYDLPRLVVTRSEAGLSVFSADAAPLHLPATATQVVDVSGAGDTVIATLAAAWAVGADLPVAAAMANHAAGIVVGRAGTAKPSAEDLKGARGEVRLEAQRFVEMPASPGGMAPLLDAAAAAAQVRAWQAQGLKVGFTNGCFDILHFGHVTYLGNTRAHCDRLVVALNHDASVKLLKGPERPLHDEVSRAAVIGALASVDLVVLFGACAPGEDNTPCALLAQVRPDIYFKGGDYRIEDLPEAAVMMRNGGQTRIMALYDGHSTTATIGKMKKSGAA